MRGGSTSTPGRELTAYPEGVRTDRQEEFAEGVGFELRYYQRLESAGRPGLRIFDHLPPGRCLGLRGVGALGARNLARRKFKIPKIARARRVRRRE